MCGDYREYLIRDSCCKFLLRALSAVKDTGKIDKLVKVALDPKSQFDNSVSFSKVFESIGKLGYKLYSETNKQVSFIIKVALLGVTYIAS